MLLITYQRVQFYSCVDVLKSNTPVVTKNDGVMEAQIAFKFSLYNF